MSVLEKNVFRTISDHRMLLQGDRVLCCVSGGADSTALLHVLSKSAPKLGISVFAIHVNHGLRGTESDRDEAFVRELCEKNGVKLTVRRLSLETQSAIEETARELRYQAFFDAADEFLCNRIATAHTEDDNAETVLLHLTRGSGLHGLTGIPAVRGNIIRPMISVSRDQVLSYLKEFEIPYCEDSSNDSVVFSRNRIRHRVLSELRVINPAVARSISKTAVLLAQDEDYIQTEVDRCLLIATESNGAWRYPCECLLKLHPAIRSRVFLQLARNAMEDQTYSLESTNICDITDLITASSPSGELCLPSDLVVRRVYDALEFARRVSYKTEACQLTEGTSCRFGRFIVRWLGKNETKIHKNFMLYELNSGIIPDCITVRGRAVGDRIKLEKRPEKSLKCFMIDEKIEKHLRDELPVLTDGENLILVHEIGIDEQYVPKSDQEKIKIEIGLCFDENERSTDQ